MKKAFLMVMVGALSLLAAGQAMGATPGLISYWRLNECSGTTATDSIHANNGTLVNGPSWAAGRVGCALSLDGTDDHVAVTPSETLTITDQLTIEAWVNMAAPAGGPQHYVVDSRDGTQTGGYGLNVDTELIQFWIGEQYPNFPVSVTAGEWHHVVGTYDGATMVIYIDGNPVGTTPFRASSSPSTAPLYIGQRYTFSEIFYGSIDEVAIYNRALSLSEVQQHYQNGLDGLGYEESGALLQNPANGHWYERFDTTMTWHEAKAFCDAKGGYLATVTSQTENDFVYGNLAALGTPQWSWLGATDELAEGTWKWVTPEPFSYTNWAGGEPNNCNTENHLMYFTLPDGRAGTWNDLNTGNSGSGVPGGCGCGGCINEWYPMSTICEWGGFCTKAPAGMISWWPGDLTANDTVSGNDGTLVNGAAFAQGKVGPAFSFDGIDDYVRIPHNENLNPTGPFSVDVWIKADPQQFSSDGLFVIIDKSHGFIDGTGWVMQGVQSDVSCEIGMGRPCVFGEVIFGFGRGIDPAYPGDFIITGTGKSVLDNEWHHLAGVFTGTELQMYLDGVLTWITLHSNSPVNNARDVFIGKHGVFDVRHFHGLIDEVEYINRALTGDEVRAIYLTGAAGKCKPAPAQCAPVPAGLVSWWPAEGNGVDLTGLNPGTLTGTTAFGGGMVGQAFAFPATFDGVLIPNSPSLQLQSFTVDAWVKRDRLDLAGTGPSCSEGEIFVYGYGGYGLGMCGDGSLFLTQVGIDNVNSGPVVTDTAWHHVAATKTVDGAVFFYVDGMVAGPFMYNPIFVFNTPTAIGNRGDSIADPASGNPPANFYGLIDEVQVFNRGLTADEVMSIYVAGQAGKCRELAVTIDITPGGFPNSINPASRGVIPVAILTTGTFNAAIVDAATVRFGPNSAPPSSFLLQDVDLDGDLDLVLQFTTLQTGIVCGTTSATLTGMTTDGVAISGTDSVRTVNCR